mmetsp:Transcript_30353/g.28996  ORF Transcript_30353/g.28996 Transcript_30353/m.28996 type:complete len:102 (+) Transcript_30353:254-559(+)
MYLISMDSTFPVNPFNEIVQPRLKGFIKRMKKPLKKLDSKSLAANPIVRPDTLKRDNSGAVSKPKVPSTDRIMYANVTHEQIFAVIAAVSGSLIKGFKSLL